MVLVVDYRCSGLSGGPGYGYPDGASPDMATGGPETWRVWDMELI